MASRMTLGFWARTTIRMKLSSAGVGKTAGGTGLVLNMLSYQNPRGDVEQTVKLRDGERCLG